jgi:16S rRNA (guanine966-N2)-methyltransferase
LRITSGNLRGRIIEWVAVEGLRPTLEKIRQAVFNILGNDLSGIAFLDLFSGTGIHGFEALSRGAAQAVWVEQNPLLCKQIQKNAEKLKLEPSMIRVVCGQVQRVLPRLNGAPFDCIYMDPPYSKSAEPVLPDNDLYVSASDLIQEFQLLAKEGILVTEYTITNPVTLPGLHLVDERKYGTVGIRFWKWPLI